MSSYRSLGILSLALSCAIMAIAADPDKTPKAADTKVDESKVPEIPELQKILTDVFSPDAAVAEPAAKGLLKGLQEHVKTADKPYIRKLNEELNADKPELRAEALKTLTGTLGDLRKANEKLWADISSKLNSKTLSDRDSSRVLLVASINQVIETDIVDKLIEGLASTDAAAAAAAAKKLQEMGANAASGLAAALEDERAAVKKTASEVLKAMGPAAKEAASDLAFLLDNEDKGTRRLAAMVLENLGPDAAEVVEDMVLYLDSDKKTVRRAAAGILKKMGAAAKEATTDLVDLLTSDDKNVRSLAADVLTNLGAHAKEGVEGLSDIISDDANDVDSRERAARVLAAIGPDAKESLDVLKKYEKDENVALRDAVQAAIKKIQP